MKIYIQVMTHSLLLDLKSGEPFKDLVFSIREQYPEFYYLNDLD